MKLKEKLMRWLIAHNDMLAQSLNKTPLDEVNVNEPLAALCRQVAAEGVVLLKNDGVLPLNKDKTVSLFGRVQQDYFYVGYGSGGDVISPYCVSPLQAVTERGDIAYNHSLADKYRGWCAENPPFDGIWGMWPTHYDEMPLTGEEIRAAAGVSDTAVLFIGRAMGESQDNKPKPGGYYLTAEEKKLLKQVTDAFESTVVVIDAGNQLDLSVIESYGEKVSAVLYAWQGGMESGNAVVDVLYGEVNPSGKLTDTIARSYKDYPAAANFGNGKANAYEEDIYVGYRYFETFCPGKVLYPFGYGLSYTSFRTAYSLKADETELSVTVRVENTGERSGKETVQLYVEAPQGLLGKPARSLAAWEKTRELAPGEKQSLTMTVAIDSLASYDDGGVTGNRGAWVLEPGEYRVYAGTDVRSAALTGSFTLASLRVTEQVQNECSPKAELTRIKPEKTRRGYKVLREPVPRAEDTRRKDILDSMPSAIPQTGDKGITLQAVKAGQATLEAFIAQLDNEELELITIGEGPMDSPFGPKGNAGMLGGTTESLRKKGVPTVITTDGPSGVRVKYYASLLPCGTAIASCWNTELTERLGALYGEEVKRLGSDMILAPGMNIHRDPMCGRNFEYYSEDPYLTGKTAAAMVRGLQSSGKSACPKHFACNNQEYRRNVEDSRLSERALREIYLKGFEICVKEAEPLTIMSSYNKVNGVWSHYNYELITGILRGEWGYKGLVITDWWMQNCVDPDFPAVQNNAYRVRGGIDVLMPGSTGFRNNERERSIQKSLKTENGITIAELQQCARRVLELCMKVK